MPVIEGNSDGHGVHRQMPMSTLHPRQRCVLLVLKRHGPVQQHLIPFWIARDQPAAPAMTADHITHALQMLYELGWAEPTSNGWNAKPENT